MKKSPQWRQVIITPVNHQIREWLLFWEVIYFFCQIAQAGKYVSFRNVILLRYIRGMMSVAYEDGSLSAVLQIINLIIGKAEAVVDKLSQSSADVSRKRRFPASREESVLRGDAP